MNDPTEITALTTQLTSDNLANWSDSRRATFVDTFEKRVKVSQYILFQTAERVAERAKVRHFIGADTLGDIFDKFDSHPFHDRATNGYSNYNRELVGGRPVSELEPIIEERTQEIISALPSLATAVRTLSPVVADQIEKRDKLLEKGKEIYKQVEELGGSLDMDDLDQSMTLADFANLLKDRSRQRAALLTKLDDIGTQGQALTTKINKYLYKGLPGLSEAVAKVVNDYLDRVTMFSTMNRRVSEQVQFGDSQAALDILKSFEQDEAKVSIDIKVLFDTALANLKLSAAGLKKAKPTKKALKSGKK